VLVGRPLGRPPARLDGSITCGLRSLGVTLALEAFCETVQAARLVFACARFLLTLLRIAPCGLGVALAESEKGHELTIPGRAKGLVRMPSGFPTP
jgi:hypothetical protein